MSCSQSKIYDHYPDLAKHRKVFKTIGLNGSRIEKLHKAFCRMDNDGSGSLSFHEMLNFLKIPNSPFATRVFSIFDEDNSGEIDFGEFVLSMWNYCTLTKPSLIIFAFDLYDTDRSGAIEISEMRLLLRDVYGNEFARNRLAAEVLEKIEKIAFNIGMRKDQAITVEVFARFCDSHPGLLYPAFSFQQALQRKVLGQQFWSSLAKCRITLPTGVQVPVQDILESHTSKKKFNELKLHDQPGAERIMKEEVKKAIPQERNAENDVDFQDVFNVTGTNARREEIRKKMLRANSKLKAVRALTSMRAAKAAAAGNTEQSDELPQETQRVVVNKLKEFKPKYSSRSIVPVREE